MDEYTETKLTEQPVLTPLETYPTACCGLGFHAPHGFLMGLPLKYLISGQNRGVIFRISAEGGD